MYKIFNSKNQNSYIQAVLIFVSFLSITAIVGYILNYPLLTSITHFYPSMKLLSSLGFLFFCVGYYLKYYASTHKIFSDLSKILILAVCVIGTLGLYQNLINNPINIEYQLIQLLNRNSFIKSQQDTSMSLTGSICFILLSSSIFVNPRKTTPLNTIIQYLLHCITLISFIILIGYLYHVKNDSYYSIYPNISLQTTLSFFLISIITAFQLPNTGFVGLFNGNNIGNEMARKLFFRILFIVLLITYLRILADRYNLVDVETGIILFSSTFIITVLFLIKIVANEINVIDRKQKSAETGFKKINNILDFTPDPILIIDEKGFIKLANKQAESTFMFDKELLINQNIELLIPFLDPKNQNFYLTLNNKNYHKVISNIELNGVNKIGQNFILEINLNPIHDIDGNFYILAIRDITERKKWEIELNESNQRNKIFVQQAPNAIAMFDTNMQYMAASLKWLEDYNLKGKDIIGKSHYEIFPEIGDDWKKIHLEAMHGEINTCDEAKFERNDGTIQYITWDVRPWYISDKTIGGILMYTADITQVKNKDLEKNKIEEILDKTNEVARIGTWELDLVKGSIYWSRITKEIHETPSDFIPNLETGINFYKEGESRDKISNAVNNAILNNQIFDLEAEIVTLKGNTKWVRAIGQPEVINNECQRIYGVFQDIDKVKKIEKDVATLLEATTDQNERLKNFAHIVSHNLRSHATNIEMMLNIYLAENKNIAENEVLQLMKTSTTNLKETIHHLSDVVVMNTLVHNNFVPVNLHDALLAAINNVIQLINNANVEVINNIDKNINVRGLRAYFDSIILNFLTNAIKYRSEDRAPFVKFSSNIKDNVVILEITDNGIGIDLARNKSKLFGMYKTFNGNADARGIGLYISKNQIEAMGGTVEVQSELNKGTTFKIYLKNAE